LFEDDAFWLRAGAAPLMEPPPRPNYGTAFARLPTVKNMLVVPA